MRAITGVGLAASVVNVVVGGGIFVLPALLAAEAGTAAPVAQLIGGVAVLLVAAVAINLIRIGSGTRLIAFLTVVKIATLLLFLAFAVPLVQLEHLTWTEVPSSAQLARGGIMSFFALGGIEMALGASGEIRNPQQTSLFRSSLAECLGPRWRKRPRRSPKLLPGRDRLCVF